MENDKMVNTEQKNPLCMSIMKKNKKKSKKGIMPSKYFFLMLKL
jgi:hypothetical protein